MILWSVFLFYIDVETIVRGIGLHNTLLILFVIAAIAGTSFFTTTAFYVSYLTYITAGFDPLILGIVGGLGMSVGDSLYFYFSYKAGDVMNELSNEKYKKIKSFFERVPNWSVYFFVYLYASFVPIPNDILMIILGLMKYQFRYIAPVLILGNITLLALVAYGINISFF
jgi:membrane protein YqaA with SNARE-associated domain